MSMYIRDRDIFEKGYVEGLADGYARSYAKGYTGEVAESYAEDYIKGYTEERARIVLACFEEGISRETIKKAARLTDEELDAILASRQQA